MSDPRGPADLAGGHRAPLNYHRLLLDDPHRIEAYDRALRQLVRPGDVVLDLGAGTGVLAMLAARAGAARVHAVESMPIARLAAELVRRNGLAGRVIVHEADARTLAPVEPVDLVVGDFLGRFLVDDAMLPAVAAAGRWLKPGGRFCPSVVRLYLAPVGNLHVGAVDALAAPVLGLDFRPAMRHALDYAYHAELHPDWLLAAPAEYHAYRPPTVAAPFDRELGFRCAQGGVLRGFGGFFDATLAPATETRGEVRMTTAPGVETHWGQYLFPVAPVPVEAGDVVRVRLWLDSEVDDEIWRWAGAVTRGDAALARFEHASVQRFGEGGEAVSAAEMPPVGERRPAIVAAAARGGAAFAVGRLDEAVAAWEEAAALLTPDDEDLAGPLYENVGLAWYNLGRDGPAIRAFLRALDGDLTRREQSLRFLVTACLRAGRRQDATRYLVAYQAAFGAHPSGITLAALTG